MPRPIRHRLTFVSGSAYLTSHVSSHTWHYLAQNKADAMAANAILGTSYLVERDDSNDARPYRVVRYVNIYTRRSSVDREQCVIVATGSSAHDVVRQLWALQNATGSSSYRSYRAAELEDFIPGTAGYAIYRSLFPEGTPAMPRIPTWGEVPPDSEGTRLIENDTMRATVYAMPNISALVADALHRVQEEEVRVRWTTCPRCYNLVAEHRTEEIETWRNRSHSERVCQPCARQHVRCVQCERHVHRYDICTSPENDTYCPDCFRANYTHCGYCGNNYNHNHMDECGCEESQEARGCDCDECLSDRDSMHDGYSGDIRNYSYRPRPEFRGEGPLYFGMEIEVTASRYVLRERAADVKNAFGDLVYLKEDGSISSGFEIVTHPMSYQWAMDNVDWSKWQFLSHQGIGADDSTGIHIHVSRAGFAGPAHTYRWLQFFYRSQEFVQKIARRSNTNYARFNSDQRQQHFIAAKGKDARCGRCYDCRNGHYYCGYARNFERYSAINCQNENTFEVRVFASTVNATQIKAALGLVSASVEYTRGINSNMIIRDDAWSWSSFATWVAQRPEYAALTEEINRLCVC